MAKPLSRPSRGLPAASRMVKYLEILFRFRVRFAILLVLVPAIAGIGTILLFPTYKATAQIWVENPSYFGSGSTPSGWNQYLTPAQNEADSLNQLLETRAFGNALYDGLAPAVADPGARIRALTSSKLTITSIGTHLVVVSAVCDRPPICVAIVNTAMDVLKQLQIQFEKDQATAGMAFVSGQLKDAEAGLAAAESALQTYLVNNPTIKVDPIPDNNGPELARLLATRDQLRAKVSDLQTSLDRDRYVSSVSTSVIESGPRVVDPPQVVGTGLTGDGSSKRTAVIAAGCCFAVGLAYLFILAWVDKTARDPREVEKRLQISVVTTIPRLSPAERI
jgi:capsular polysaccharide biosynthesis protein